MLLSTKLVWPLWTQTYENTRRVSSVILDVMEADGLTDLVVVVGVVLPGGQLQERLRDQLALAVPGTSHSLIKLEDGITHVHVRGHTLCLRFPLVIVDRTCGTHEEMNR